MAEEVSADILKQVYPERRAAAHKGDFGHLLVIGGSKLYSGSPAFNALAAYRAGVDLVTVVAPQRAADIVASFSPDLITYPVTGDFFNVDHLPEVEHLLAGKSAVVIGGGMGRERETREFIRRFLRKLELPAVVDADAIYAPAEEGGAFSGKEFVFTPHAHEFRILTGRVLPEEEVGRTEVVREAARALETVILAKGDPDTISDGERALVNRTGNPFMTVGGTGDTLAGICGAYLAMGIDPLTAASAAAFVNGQAGDLAAEELGPSLVASDLLNFIPKTLPS